MTAPQTLHDYAYDVFQRARVPMPPFDYEVRWREQPRRHKIYPVAPTYTLPIGEPVTTGFWDALRGAAGWPADEPLEIARLGRGLQDTYGLISRRLRVSGNDDSQHKPRAMGTTYARGTANGGGLYPLEFYWINGPSARPTPGIHHWDTSSGRLQRLLAGDVSDHVVEALGVPAHTDQFLLVTVKYWKNSFKYNSFTHHVVTMDLGATLMTLRLEGIVDEAAGRVSHLWFDSSRLDSLLGLDSAEETTLAVIPLPGGPDRTDGVPAVDERPDRHGAVDDGPDPAAAAVATDHPVPAFAEAPASDTVGRPHVELAESERFTRRVPFPAVDEVVAIEQASGEVPRRRLPEPSRLPFAADAPRIALPELPTRPGDALSDVVGRRRSSFGTFSSAEPLTLAELAQLIDAVTLGAQLPTDAGTARFTRPAVFVNHVDRVPAGTYLIDIDTRELVLADPTPPGEFLQAAYFLDNYNVEQAAAVITLLVPVTAVLDTVGGRGIRLANAVTGAATQACYLAAAELGIACGAALGFDNVGYAELLGVAETGERPMIMLMVGRDRGDQADFRFPLSTDFPRGEL
ncbi:nitroreductase family protein [Brachybacterium sp. DNPG3]